MFATAAAPDPTRLFLARVMAWPQDGETPAYVNIHYKFSPSDISTLQKEKDGSPKYPWTGNAGQDLGAVVSMVKFFDGADFARDIYFCTSTQAFAEQKVSSRGKPTLKAVRSAENAVKMKSLFIDSDLKGGDHGYDTPQEFSAALVAFLKATGLPRPTMMVASGGGFHIYWTLARALTVAEWAPMAFALAEATKREGFKCDTAVTIDAARVLRVPGTKNYKYDPPRPVSLMGTPVEYDYAVEKLEAALSPYKVAVPLSVNSPNFTIFPPRSALDGVSDLAAGVDSPATAPISLDSLVFQCGFVGEALATGGAAFSNPLWNLSTLLATFTEGGRADAHRMASGHPNYGPGETDDLYDRKLQEKLSKNMGWPKCSAIRGAGCNACSTCPLFIQGKSPLNFGTRGGNLQGNTQAGVAGVNVAPAANQPGMGFSGSGGTTPPANPQTALQAPSLVPGTGVQDPDLPHGYLRNPNGVILFAQANEDGTSTWMPLLRYPMVDPFLERDPWTLNFTTETEHGQRSRITITTRDVGTAEMRKELQEQGMILRGGIRTFNLVSDFLMAWIEKLQSTKGGVTSSTPFGWMVRGGKTHGFVYGGENYTPAGTEIATTTDPELQRQFSPCGDRQPWVDAAKMVTDQDRPALDAILASAFGAPLVRFTGHSGLLMSAYSIESGIGKSTALKIAQAVWGDPVKAIQSLSDTQNSVLNKLGELRSLPMYWDELKSEDDAKRFVDTVFRLTLGKEKSRMTSKVTQRATGTWQTMLVSGSNESLMDVVAYKTRATTAGIYRIFEYTVAPPKPGTSGQIDPTVAQRMISRLHDNYGTIGSEYARYLGGNHPQIEADMEKLQADLNREVSGNPDERFWIALMSSILLGARYANSLGYTSINVFGLKQFLVDTLASMRKQRSLQPVDMRDTANVVNVLGRFLNEKRARNTLTTSIIHRQKGKPPAGSVVIVGDSTRIDSIQVHVGANDRILRIGRSYLTDWLTQNNYPRHVLITAMEDQLGAQLISARLGAGTAMAGATEYLLEIDLNSSTPLMDFLSEA